MPRSPRSAAVAGALALVLVAACGRSPEEEPSASAPTTSTVSPATSTAPDDTTAAPETTAGPVDTAAPTTEAGPTTTGVPKPDVEIPEEIPTELVVTDIEEGDGPAAKNGDTVVV